jgi:hypothetical protein
VTASGLTGVTLDSDSFPAGMQVMAPIATVTVSNCSVSGQGLLLLGSPTSVVVSKSVFTQLTGAAGVELQGGSGNQILNNSFDGGYDGGSAPIGVDDDILLINESEDTVQGNTIANAYDTAVEGVNSVANTVIANNTVVNIGTAAFGTYYCTDWVGNAIRGNNVARAPQFLEVQYLTQKCGVSSPPPATFTGNQIVSNTVKNPAAGVLGPSATSLAAIFVVFNGGGTVSGNLIQGNDFGTQVGPEVQPLSGFIDGGGNICSPSNAPFPNGSDWNCSGGALQANQLRVRRARANPFGRRAGDFRRRPKA